MVYPKIRRGKRHYLHNMGAYSDDLAVLVNFFSEPWVKPNENLDKRAQASILRSVGYRLRSLGRIKEAISPFRLVLEIYKKLEDHKEIAIAASNLIEPYLTLGEVRKALKMAEEGVENIYQTDPKPERLLHRASIYARALHQSGKKQNAQYYFCEAEKFQQQNNHKITYLTKLPGFLYSELLLEDKDLLGEAMARATESLAISEADHNHLFIGLSKLIIGRVNLREHENNKAQRWIAEALDALRKANDQDHLPRGLLARASWYRYEGLFGEAHKDLKEVFDIAEPSEMRLHLTDYHLEMARLLVAAPGFDFAQPSNPASHDDSGTTRCLSEVEGNMKQARTHAEAAAKLINETGYHRRDAELAELQQHLA